MSSCIHLTESKTQAFLSSYEVIVRFSLLCKRQIDSPKHAKKLNLSCHCCKDTIGRLFACIDCVFFGCYDNYHIQDHLSTKNHAFAVNMDDGSLYCLECKDHVYDHDLSEIIKSNMKIQRRAVSKKRDANVQTTFKEWEPTKEQKLLLEHQSVNQPCAGLRGMHNLGNTCFISSVLQTMIHNPLLSAYFLSDAHDIYACTIKSNRGVCFGCEFTQIFSKFYSGDLKPYIPHQFLYSMWLYAEHLAGYAQQDAHEFFISLLSGLHGHCGGQTVECQCIVHSLFSGLLQSDVKCLSCGHISSTLDPFFDVSLELKLEKIKEESHSPSKSIDFHKKNSTLHQCLLRFTHPEKLDTGAFKCGHCMTYQESTKQLSFNRLPCVLSFHLKRFEHSMGATKIDTFIEFPLLLNMTSYLSQFRNPEFEFTQDNPNNEYELYAVIIHKGGMETGHYIACVKHRHEWYHLDDAVITRTSLAEVLQSNAYMLFYMKRTLEYSV